MKMKKLLLILVMMIVSTNPVLAIGGYFDWLGDIGAPEVTCGNGICEGILFETEMQVEADPENEYYCAADCQTCEEQGYISESDCPDGTVFTDRGAVEEFCEGYGYIRATECDDCDEYCLDGGYIYAEDCPASVSVGNDCWNLGYIPRTDCTNYLNTKDIENLCRGYGGIDISWVFLGLVMLVSGIIIGRYVLRR